MRNCVKPVGELSNEEKDLKYKLRERVISKSDWWYLILYRLKIILDQSLSIDRKLNGIVCLIIAVMSFFISKQLAGWVLQFSVNGVLIYNASN